MGGALLTSRAQRTPARNAVRSNPGVLHDEAVTVPERSRAASMSERDVITHDTTALAQATRQGKAGL
jgi:hypothetical protein